MYYKSLLNKEFKIVSNKVTISGILVLREVLREGRSKPCIENAEITFINQDGSVTNHHEMTWFLYWGSSFECFNPLCYEISEGDFFILYSDGVPVYTNHDIFEYARK